eukprot:2518641-Amphidinium_carterae.1
MEVQVVQKPASRRSVCQVGQGMKNYVLKILHGISAANTKITNNIFSMGSGLLPPRAVLRAILKFLFRFLPSKFNSGKVAITRPTSSP